MFKGGYLLENIGVDGRIILKCIFMKDVVMTWTPTEGRLQRMTLVHV
jgi:hypothetical protein